MPPLSRVIRTSEGKVCTKCNQFLSYDDFTKETRQRDGLAYRCKDCIKRYERENIQDRPARHRLRNYGITDEEYQALINEQNNLCAICGKTETHTHKGKIIGLCVDHDHKTGKVRGLLCWNCNIALGNFKDSSENLSSAIDYLMGLNR